MENHMIAGGGGTRLHVVETGNPSGRPIVLIHGFSQCWMNWKRQMNSGLADDHRLIAMDLRGHGLSDKPRDGYADSRLWAEDVNAVIRELVLDHPILCGWSYGPLVILDYIRHYGDGDIGGANFIGGVTKLGSEEALSVLSAEFLSLVPGFFSTDTEESVRALAALLHLCHGQELATEDYYLALGYNATVPAYVRQALFARSIDNDDLLTKIRKPVLITQGTEDAVVKTTVNDQQMARIAHARFRIMEKSPHACFWGDADAYNRDLKEFAAAL